MKCLIAIVGPTAIGKSQLAMYLSRLLDEEIIGADSRQVYRYMDIGTAKPSLTDRHLVPHHLIDIINPDDAFSLAIYLQSAQEKIKDIQQKNKLPLLVGGSGLYVRAIVEGWTIPTAPPNYQLRHALEDEATWQGNAVLYKKLEQIDPLSAQKIAPTNTRRIIRALEIYHATGQAPSTLQKKKPPDFPVLIIGLTAERANLYRRIDCRVDNMMEKGLVKEVNLLAEKGYSPSLPAMSSVGYRQIGDFLQGRLSLPLAIEQVKYETHRLARRQYAWFRLDNNKIHWFNADDGELEIKAGDLIKRFLQNEVL